MARSFHAALSYNICPVGSSIGQAIWVGTRFTVLEKVEFAFLSWRVRCQKRDESHTFKSNCLAASATRAECTTEVYHRDRDFHSLLGKASLKEGHIANVAIMSAFYFWTYEAFWIIFWHRLSLEFSFSIRWRLYRFRKQHSKSWVFSLLVTFGKCLIHSSVCLHIRILGHQWLKWVSQLF